MRLDRYAHMCGAIASELAESLTTEDVTRLKADLDGETAYAWMAWRTQNEQRVAAFVAASPSERQRRKAWRQDRLRLTLAAIQHSLEGHAVLDAVEREALEPGDPYRKVASRAGLAYSRIFGADIPDWPFDNDSPFAPDD